MKKLSICILLIALSISLITACQKDSGYESIDYSNNIESIEHYFYEINDIERVYFKSKSLSSDDRSVNIGPSSATIVGFICVSENERQSLIDKYDFSESTPEFPSGISPEITGYDSFDWKADDSFTHYVTKGNLVGDIYLDINNGVIYVDVGIN